MKMISHSIPSCKVITGKHQAIPSRTGWNIGMRGGKLLAVESIETVVVTPDRFDISGVIISH